MFNYVLKYLSGDFRNIVYIVYWDGFSFFGIFGGYSIGVIDVKIVNMFKSK